MIDNTTQRTTFSPIIGSGWIMTPTNKLRFIERTVRGQLYSHSTLQQWWERRNSIPSIEVTGEWRDVPIEKEFIDKDKNT